jgi:outer membrane protein assembly factor BamB
VLVGGVLVVACDGADVQYVIGLDAETGNLRWKTPRHKKAEMAYSTPLVIDVDGAPQVVSSGGGGVSGYDPATGQEIWRCRYEGHSVIPRPVFADGLIYVCSGYWTPSLYAIEAGGAGDITSTHIVKTFRRGVPLTTSPLINGDELYLMADMGVLTSIDLVSGKERWRERLKGNYSASPTLAGGLVYVTNEEGTTTVFEPGPALNAIATNQIAGRTLASPAFVGEAIYLRSDTHLYCIGNPGQPLRVAARARKAAPVPGDKSKVRRASATAPQ